MSRDVDALLDRLNAIAAIADVPYPHWLGGDEADQGPSYCNDCAQKQVVAGNAEFVDGGWPQENDGCCHCEDCGRLLDYTLTDYGVQAEMEHFQGGIPAESIEPETAYHLARLLEQADHDHPEVIAILADVRAALDATPPDGAEEVGNG